MTVLKWISRTLFGLAGIAACWGAWYVVYQDSLAKVNQELPEEKKSKLAVEVVSARQDTIDDRIVLVGSLYPVSQTDVRNRAQGYVVSLPVRVGDQVQVGDTLVLLDDESQREAVTQATAALNVARAQLRAKQTEFSLAERTVARQKKLELSGAGTEQQLEAAEAQLQIAQAGVDLEEANVAQAEADLLQAKLALKDLKLTAPISGYVADRAIDVGDLATSDLPLMRIVNLDVVQTNVQVVEKDYNKIRVGNRAEVTVDAFPGRVFRGVVKRIAPVLDPATRTAQVHIEVDNAEHFLKPGMFARVSLRSNRTRPGILVPIAAVLNAQDRPTVMVACSDAESGTKVEERRVELGMSDEDTVEILSGLEPGDEVITMGNRLVRTGQEVTAMKVSWPESSLVAESASVRDETAASSTAE